VTAKSGQAISDAINLAKEEGHQQLAPIHLAISLWEDNEGVWTCVCVCVCKCVSVCVCVSVYV
jgi:ATP-dependent Clp protease ATP-binding subunit ClpA